MKKLVKNLVKQGYLESPHIIEAFENVNREHFLIPLAKGRGQEDEPISLGFGQTISQPSTVAFMFELLNPQEDDRVLDVGSGSGYTSALFSYIVGKGGKVFAIEVIEELKDFGERNVKDNYSFIEQGTLEFMVADGSKGLPKEAPFDIIHVAAAALEPPQELLDQLATGGHMVMPVGEYCHEIHLFTKDEKGQVSKEKFPGFAFVPLVSKEK